MAITTTHNNLVPYSTLAKRDDKNVSIEPVTVSVIQERKPIGILGVIVLALILTGFTAWTVNIVSPSPTYQYATNQE